MTTRYGDFHASGGNLGLHASTIRRDVVEKIFYKEANLTPLIQLMRRASKGKAESFKHEWIEKDDMPLFTQINNGAGYSDSDAALVVDDSSVIAITSILYVERTGETMRVTANNTSTNTVTVARSWGGTAAAALLDNDYVHVLGTAPVEGDEAQVGQAVIEEWKYNFVQEFRDSYGLTDIAKNTTVHGGIKTLPKLRAERMRDHKKKMEMAMFLGERGEDVSGDEPIRTMGGLHEWITTNVYDFGTAFTFEEAVTAAEGDFEYGSDRKLCMGGKTAMSAISLIAQDKIRHGDIAKTHGVKMDLLATQHGDYVLIRHRLFRGSELPKRCYIIDPNSVAWVPMAGGDTRVDRNQQANSAKAEKEEIYTAATMRRKLEDTCGRWDNLAA